MQTMITNETTVFLIYSRVDIAKVTSLKSALDDRGITCFQDITDITPSELWMEKVENLIATSDGVVFVASNLSANSGQCQAELMLAEKFGKRIFPYVIDDTANEEWPEGLRLRHWVIDKSNDISQQALNDLISALQTDIEWVSAHSRYLGNARRWNTNGRPNNQLLRGRDINQAQVWLENRTDINPPVLKLQIEFLNKSARYRRHLRYLAILIVVGLLVAGFVALEREFQARQEALFSEAEKLAEMSMAATNQDPVLATRLGLQSWAMNPYTKYFQTGASLEALSKTIQTQRLRKVYRLGKLEEEYVAPTSSIHLLPNSSSVVVYNDSDKSYQVVDLISNLVVSRPNLPDQLKLDYFASTPQGISYSGDGMTALLIKTDGTAVIWDRDDTGGNVEEFGKMGSSIKSVILTPDGQNMMLVSVGRARIIDLYGKTQQEFTLGETMSDFEIVPPVIGSAMSPDGSLFATGYRPKNDSDSLGICVFETLDGTLVTCTPTYTEWFSAIRFSPWSNFLAFGGNGGQARILSMRDGEVYDVRSRPGAWISSLAFSPSEVYVAIGANISITTPSGDISPLEVWRVSDIIDRFDAKDGIFFQAGSNIWSVSQVEFTNDGRSLLATNGRNEVYVFDAGTGAAFWQMFGGEVDAYIADPGWNDRTQEIFATLVNRRSVSEIIVDMPSLVDLRNLTSPDPLLNREFFAFNFETNQRRPLDTQGKRLLRAYWSLNGHYLATTFEDSNELMVFNFEGFQKISTTIFHSKQINDVFIQNDGSLVATASEDGTAIVWDISLPNQPVILIHSAPVVAVALSQISQSAATISGDTLYLWDLNQPQSPRLTLPGYTGMKHEAFSTDGKYIAVTTSITAMVLETSAGNAHNFMFESSDMMFPKAIGFVPNSNLVAVSYDANPIILWDVNADLPVLAMDGHKGGSHNFSFSADGSRMISSGTTPALRMWRTDLLEGDIVTKNCLGYPQAYIATDWVNQLIGATVFEKQMGEFDCSSEPYSTTVSDR